MYKLLANHPWGATLAIALMVWVMTLVMSLLGGADGGSLPDGWIEGGGLLAVAAVFYRQLEKLIDAFLSLAKVGSEILQRLARIDAALDLPAPPADRPAQEPPVPPR